MPLQRLQARNNLCQGGSVTPTTRARGLLRLLALLLLVGAITRLLRLMAGVFGGGGSSRPLAKATGHTSPRS